MLKGTWVIAFVIQGSNGMLREEREQEDRSSSSLSSEVAVKQHPPQSVPVQKGEDESGLAEVGARIITTGRVGIAAAPASKISCDDANCTKTPSYYESDRRRCRYYSHKLENMVYLKRRKCAEPDCTRLSSYGRVGGGTRYCLLHKTTPMVDLVNRRCETLGCNRRPVFAIAGQKARLCSDHRKVDMTDVANHLCSAFRCGLKACWGLPGRRATFCFIHRIDEMQKRGGGGSGTASQWSWSGINSVVSIPDEVEPSRVSDEMPTIDPGDDTTRSYSASEVVKEEPFPATHSSREWTLPVGMIRTRDEMATVVSGLTSRNGARTQPFIIPPGQHLHQHFQHPSPQSSLVPGESTSMLNGAHRAHANQHLNHGNPVPASAAFLLSHLRRQPQPTPCYPQLFPSSTVAKPYAFGNPGRCGFGGGAGGFSSAHQVGLELGLDPMLIDSRLQQQQQLHHQHAAFQLQIQHHNMYQMHMQLSAGAMFRPTSNGGEHSSSVSNSTG